MSCKEPSVVYLIPKDENTLREKVIPEATTCTIRFKLSDPITGGDVPNTAITSSVMRIFNESDKSIIQVASSDDTDVKSFFAANGQFSYLLEAAANAMVADDDYTQYEIHWARFTTVLTSGVDTHTYVFNYQLKIENNKFVTST